MLLKFPELLELPEVTVNTAAALALPALLVITTAKLAPLSDAIAAGVVYVDDVAPAIALPFLRH